MADKPTVKYEVRAQRDPVNNVTIYVPAIVDRNAAKSLATGLCEQLFKEFRDGNAVNFDGYFYGRLYLDGTVNADGRISFANRVNTSSRPDGDWWGKPVLLTATIDGEEVRHWVTFYDPYA